MTDCVLSAAAYHTFAAGMLSIDSIVRYKSEGRWVRYYRNNGHSTFSYILLKSADTVWQSNKLTNRQM